MKNTEQEALRLKIYPAKEVARAILFDGIDRGQFVKVVDFEGNKVGYYALEQLREVLKQAKKITF